MEKPKENEFIESGLDIKIAELKDIVDALKAALEELRTKQQSLPEAERASLDGEIKRYEDSIAINEREVEQLSSDLFNQSDTTGPLN